MLFKKKLTDLEKEYSLRKNEYEKINQRKEKLTEDKTLFENKRNLQEDIKKLQSKIEERQKIIEKQNKESKRFEKIEPEIKEAEIKLDKINDEVEKAVKQIEKKKTLIESIRKDITGIKSKKKRIERMGADAQCPTCERVLGKQYDVLVKKFDEENAKKHSEIESFLKEIKTSEDDYERAAREEQALQKKRKYLQSLLREKERVDTTISNILDEIKREETEIENKEKQMKKIGPVKFDLDEYKTVKNKVDEFYKKYQSTLDLLNERKDRLASAKLELEKKEGEKNLVIQKIKNLQQMIEELKKFKNQIKEEKKSLQYLNIIGDIMASFRTHLISRIRPTLSSYASDFFERLTDGKYREIELDENYNLMVYDDGNCYGIERFSGGEEDLANLCLRLAISEVITERAGGIFNFIILDEIFGSQDMIRRQNIMKALNGLSSKFRQIFLITHVEDVKNFMENTIIVTEDESGMSKTKIE